MLKAFAADRRLRICIRVFIGYVTVCLLFALGKQVIIWRHQQFLIKENKQKKKYHDQRRKQLKTELELAVVKGNEAEVERLRKELAVYIRFDEERAKCAQI